MTTSFSGGRSWSTQREPPTMGKQLVNFITCGFESSAPFLYARLKTGRIMWLDMAGGRTHRFPHNNFSSAYRIFTKLGHMIPLWKGKNPIYFGVITIIPFDNLYRQAYFVMHTFLVYNLQSRVQTHAILVIGLYELLCNPTT